MNRRDAFRTALAAAVAAMMPRPENKVDEIARIFGVPAVLVRTPIRGPEWWVGEMAFQEHMQEVHIKLAEGMWKKIDADWRSTIHAS